MVTRACPPPATPPCRPGAAPALALIIETIERSAGNMTFDMIGEVQDKLALLAKVGAFDLFPATTFLHAMSPSRRVIGAILANMQRLDLSQDDAIAAADAMKWAGCTVPIGSLSLAHNLELKDRLATTSTHRAEDGCPVRAWSFEQIHAYNEAALSSETQDAAAFEAMRSNLVLPNDFAEEMLAIYEPSMFLDCRHWPEDGPRPLGTAAFLITAISLRPEMIESWDAQEREALFDALRALRALPHWGHRAPAALHALAATVQMALVLLPCTHTCERATKRRRIGCE